MIAPETDGRPMAEHARQCAGIVTIQEGLNDVSKEVPELFVAGDLFWYPVEGDPTLRVAPEGFVGFSRPKGRRGSYRQWQKRGIAPQVGVAMLAPGNRPRETLEKPGCDETCAVGEYHTDDPDSADRCGWLRPRGARRASPERDGWASPRLGPASTSPAPSGSPSVRTVGAP